MKHSRSIGKRLQGKSAGWSVVLAFTASLLAAGKVAEAAKLHAIFAVDKKAERVGADVTADRVWLALRSNIPENQLEFHNLQPDEFSEPAIRGVIARIPFAPDDTVLFYYVGHGFWDPNSGTCMKPSASTGEWISGTGMVTELKARNPRLAVVVFDCCNRERAPQPRNGPAPFLPAPGTEVSPLFDSLFFKIQGSVLVVSSSPFQYALVRAARDDDWANGINVPPGPLFTNAFSQTLNDNANRRLIWSQMIRSTQVKLDEYFRIMAGPEGLINLDDGTVVRQDRQTIQVRFFQ
jgi:Caspase domain